MSFLTLNLLMTHTYHNNPMTNRLLLTSLQAPSKGIIANMQKI